MSSYRIDEPVIRCKLIDLQDNNAGWNLSDRTRVGFAISVAGYDEKGFGVGERNCERCRRDKSRVNGFPSLSRRGLRGGRKKQLTRVFNKTTLRAKRKALRRSMPDAEVIMWSRLNRRLMQGYKFRRQYSVGSYVLDFYCPELKLAIEIDGDTHFRSGAVEYDRQRQEEIEQYGIRFLRFMNTEVYQNLYGVLQKIFETAEEITKEKIKTRDLFSTPSSILPLVKGEKGAGLEVRSRT